MTELRGADSHVHVFDPAFPFADDALYIPDKALRGTASQLAAVLASHRLTHGLLVGAAPYGPDNRPILAALKAFPGRFKGIVLIRDPGISDRDLQDLHDQGVVEIRVNLALGLDEIAGPEAARLLARIAELGWFLQIHTGIGARELIAAEPILKPSGVTMMIDHCGRPDVSLGPDQPGFAHLLELGRSGRAIVKLSGPFRFSKAGHPYADVDPFVAALIENFGLDRCVWGSDWPFVMRDDRTDYGPVMDCLSRWIPDPADRRKVLWETPSRLFGFA